MQLPEELTPAILDADPAHLTHKRRRGCMFFFFHFNYRKSVLTPSLSQAIHSFDGLAGSVVHNGHFIVTSPNRRFICHPPLGGDRSVFLRTNLRYGDDDPVQWPQPYCDTFPHYACIPACLDLPSHPHMILWLKPDRRNYIKHPGPFPGLWMLEPAIFRAFTKVAMEILERAAKPTLRDRALIAARVPHVRHFLQRLEYIPTTLRRAQLGVSGLQRLLLELIGAADWYEEFEPRQKVARSTWDQDPARTLGAFTDSLEVCDRLFRMGLPVYLVRPWDELPGIRIQHDVSTISHKDRYPEEAAINPTHRAIFHGAANDLRKYTSIYNHCESYFRYADPFGSVCAPVAALVPPAVVTRAEQALKRETRRQTYSPCML